MGTENNFQTFISGFPVPGFMKRFLNIFLMMVVLSACEGLNTSRIPGYEIHGIDVSHYQSRIDWEAIASQSIDFAFVKATEGATFKDSLYLRNWSSLKQHGIRRGAYHFFRPEVPPGIQARHFAQTVHLDSGDLPPVLDVEVIGTLPKMELVRRIQIWLEMVESHFGIKPIIYTNLHFYNRNLAGYFNGYPLWIARYHGKEPILACGTDWHFWQYGEHGRLAGIKGSVDFNVFRGSANELDALCIPPASELSSLK